ncbi:MAG: tRNA lysidine(34) synthetase TilS, partial [Kiritimatiellaceae bacterium]|nr:tRNA lysidine(34) synthetase TilS [Kiritimatiellaceae bacterium]
EWREDSSNSDETFLRNKVRHTILPMLGNELNPNIHETILRTMDILREENAWMEEMQDQSKSRAARRRVLRKWLFEHGAETAGFDAVDKILSLIDAGEGSTVFELNSRQHIVVEYGQPRFDSNSFHPLEPQWKLTTETGTGWRKDTSRIGKLPAVASFDADKIGDSPIEVRCLEPGDRMSPFGMEGRRKLQDILTDLKVPRAERQRIPVVVCRNDIIWLPGYRISKHWIVPNRSANAVHIRLEQNRAG